uniref:Uncharacterized protein n=1 Tax=Plectus sambesii TaxID=2011161 RepID=A0A914X9S0_9BILA
MNSIPGVVAATAHERGQLFREGWNRDEADDGTITVTPVTYNRVLKHMEKETEEEIDKDVKELKEEAKIINHLQKKLEKEERHFLGKREVLAEEEAFEAEVEARKLRKAQKELRKLREGHHDGIKEKIEEVYEGVKERTKNVIGNVAGMPHQMSIDAREQRIQNNEEKAEKKLREAAKRVEDLRKKLAENRKAMFAEDVEVLQKEAQKVKDLQQELETEEAKYAQLAADLAEELRYEARIREEEQKLRNLQIGTLA